MARIRSKYENKLTGEVNEEQVYREYKKNHSLHLIIGLIIVIFGYTFFFLTPVLFHKPASVLNTELKTYENLNSSVSVSVENWLYSKKQNLMEVRLNIRNVNFEKNDFSYYSFVNYDVESDGITRLKTKEQINDISYIIIWIYDIPKEYNSCSLVIRDTENNRINLYTNRNTVTKVNRIKKKNIYEYRIENYKNIILNYKNDIKVNQNEIIKCNKNIKDLQKKIEEIRNREIYQSENEIYIAENLIADYQGRIKTYKDNINSANNSISSDKENIKDYRELINKIRNMLSEQLPTVQSATESASETTKNTTPAN